MDEYVHANYEKNIRKKLESLQTNFKRKHFWKSLYRKHILKYILRKKGVYVVDEEWDYLIILDACRYDTFKEINNLVGKLEYRYSRGSSTSECLQENF